MSYVVWHSMWELTSDSVRETIWSVITVIVTTGGDSAIIAILILEIRKSAMIAGTYFERKIKRRREPDLAEARKEARAEERKGNAAEFNSLIDEWVKRRDESREKGEPFDEPPPGLGE